MTRTNPPRSQRGTTSSAPAGMAWVRTAIARAIEPEGETAAADYAAKRWGETSRPVQVLKATVPAANVQTGGGAPLLGPEGSAAASEFFAVVDASTIIGRIPFRRVPPRTAIIRGSAVASSWVGESSGKGVSPVQYQRTEGLQLCKLITLCVFTEELLRDSSPDAEAVIRQELIRSQQVALDDAFINPSNAGFSEDGPIKPASILFGAPQGSDTSPQSVTEDHLEALLEQFTGQVENAVIVMEPKLAARLTSADRPRLGATGGDWAGIRVVTSSAVPNGIIAIVDPAGVAVAMSNETSEIRISRQGSIDLRDVSNQHSGRGRDTSDFSDSPQDADIAPIATQLTSLWQTGAVAILAERHVAWRVVRPGSVVYLSGLSF